MLSTPIKHLSLTALMLTCFAVAVQAEPLDIQILSATVHDQAIEGATLTLQKNGEQSVTTVTNAQGRATLNPDFADASDSLLIVTKAGYFDLVVECPCEGMSYALNLNLDGLRIVLSWDQDTVDLDAHLKFPDGHIYFDNKNGGDARLDVDEATAGPETITLTRKHDGTRYTYAVHNFTAGNNLSSTQLSYSGARVFVYLGQTLIKSYAVPPGRVGNYWNVFTITGSGYIEDSNFVQKFMSLVQFQRFFNAPDSLIISGIEKQKYAKDFNRRGEQAYREGHYKRAILLYQAATLQSPFDSQTYSNLGLAFQKAGRSADALSANHHAIDLAYGPTATTVRASSYYNNGRIHENAGRWQRALLAYRQALDHSKSNPVYERAHQRMIDKGVVYDDKPIMPEFSE